MESTAGNGCGGLFGVVGTEDQDALSVYQEGVEIGNVDSFVRKKGDGLGGATYFVIHLDGEYFRQGNGDAGFFQHAIGTGGLAADDATDAVLYGIGYVGGDERDAGLFEQVEHLQEGARLVFDEN